MSAGGSSSDQPVDLLQKLSLDSDTKPVENPEVANKAVYGDNSSLPYQQGYNNVPYGAYPSPSSPVPIVGLDGQLLGLQEYHYPSPYYQSVTQTSRPFGPNQAGTPQVEVPTSIAAEQVSLSVEATKGNPSTVLNGGVVSGNKESNQLRPSFQNPSPNLNSSYGRGGFPTGTSLGYQDPRFSSDGSHLSSGRNNNVQLFPHFMNAHHARPTSGLGQSYGFMNHMYPNHGMYGHYGNMMGAGTGFGSFGYDSWKNGQCWYSIDNKYKNRSRSYGVTGYGKENADGLNELNRGPRAKGFKNQEGVGPATLAVKEQNVPNSGNKKENNLPLPSDMQQYNRDDFPENYSHAKFFVIKSYSEDDIHKSIKYNVWSSTPNGNKRLDAAYHEANEKPDGCPIFLFFSVNTSGQFVGIAEMVGPVDFNKTVEYWQQDKWIGCFPVKWHFIKDLPNSLLRHITLENNENKPVTNSRDTQEVKFEQGIQIIKIFKDHSSKTSILDDFGFYEARQKIIQEKKGKQQQSQKQVLDGKPDDNKVTDNKEKNMMKGEDRSQKPLDAILQEEPIVETVAKGVEVNGEPKLFQEKGSTVALEHTSEGAVPVVLSEKKVTSNGVASAC